MSSNFTPPIAIGGYKPTPGTLSEFIYQVWAYLNDTPIPDDEDIAEQVKTYVEDNPEFANVIAEIVDEYIEANPPEAPVQSVNGETGAVVLDYKDIVPSNIQIPVWIHNTANAPDATTIAGLRQNGFRFTFNSDTSKLSVIMPNGTLNSVVSGVSSVNGLSGNVVLESPDILVDSDDGDTTLKDVADQVDSISTMLDAFFGVGAIYITKDGTFDPNGVFPGTWSKLEHAFIYGAGSGDTVNDTIQGTASNTLSMANIPAHTHNYNQWTWMFTGSNGKFQINLSQNENTGNSDVYNDIMGSIARYTGSAGESAGTITPVNNMPPYLLRYIWERTA